MVRLGRKRVVGAVAWLKWSDERCREWLAGPGLMFACRQNAIDGFVQNNFYWCNGER